MRGDRRIADWVRHGTDIAACKQKCEMEANNLTAEAEWKEAERRRAEKFAALLTDADVDCLKTNSLHGCLLTINAADASASAMDLDVTFLGRSWIGRRPTAGGRSLAENAVSLVAKGGIGRFTAQVASTFGELRCCNVAIKLMRDAQGEV